jgi:hypothetical protein
MGIRQSRCLSRAGDKKSDKGRTILPKSSTEVQNLSSFVWSIAEILRGDFKQSEYGKVKASCSTLSSGWGPEIVGVATAGFSLTVSAETRN